VAVLLDSGFKSLHYNSDSCCEAVGFFNVAEIELNVMIGQCLKPRIDSVAELRDEVTAWQAQRDRLQAKVN
jgi:hypothetical protein